MRVAIVVAAVTLGLTPSVPLAQRAPAKETASRFYMRYVSTVQKASDIDQVLALWPTAVAKPFKAAPPQERMPLADMKKAYSRLKGLKVAKEEATPTGASLTLEATSLDNKKMRGTAVLTKENGEWKLTGPESWSGR